MDESEKPDDRPAACGDLRSAFLEAMKEAKEEQSAQPKRFRPDEGVEMPLRD
ncbi:MAG: hypothetical protein AAF447_07240 [Myxococcota bacterium]